MGASKYRHRITIRNATTSTDALGGQTGTGTTVATVWAARRDLGSAEFVDGAREASKTRVEFVMRYRHDLTITTAMEVVDVAGNVFDIVGVLDRKGKQRELQLNCLVKSA